VLRAETIVIDTRQYSLCAGRFSIVQLWHGTGYKLAGAAAQGSRYRAFLARHHHALYRLVTATSPRDVRHKWRIFGSSRVVVTGAPRNDVFFRDAAARPGREDFGLAAYEKVLLYAPTFRDHGAFEPFSETAWRRISELMPATQSLFAVKRHPADRGLAVPRNLPGVADLTDIAGDLQELLALADLLITDYSSIATDFALTGRPMIFYVFDREKYQGDDRKLFAASFNLVPGPFAHREGELLALLGDDAPFRDARYRDRYAQFVDQFHSHRDGRASERVLQQLRSL
jgi:CDP-glycerol glycerophosphotransferase